MGNTFWWVGVFQKNSDYFLISLCSSPDLTFNIGRIFSGKGKGESNYLHYLDLSGAMLVVIMLVMLVSIIRVMLVVIIAGDL